VGTEFYRRGEPGTVVIVFATNPEGKRRQAFRISVDPSNFAVVAWEILKADPVQANKAFGTAMQVFNLKETNRGSQNRGVGLELFSGEPLRRMAGRSETHRYLPT